MRLVVANRGEIAVRILRAARDCGLGTVALHPADAGDAPHVRIADEAAALPGEGPAAYLDRDAVVAAALRAGGPGALVHGGYGFLSEDADFAATCERSGLVFVGPSPQVLRVLGDKVAARRVAQDCRVPVLPATEAGVGADAVAAFFAEHARTGRGPGGIMIKAVAGGGGRGIREVHDADEVPGAYASCRAEARAGFGDDDLYAEALLAGARHVEVQIVGDGSGVVAVGDRDCSVQRRHQKLVEVAPAQGLDEQVRTAMQDAAVRIGRKVGYAGLGTVEFLLDGGEFVFLEVNPRIQVEHTVTEEVTGIDLVAAQLRVARGATLGDLGLDPGEAATKPRGIAVQARVNAERVDASGRVYASAGVLDEFAPPAGPGVRVDTAAHRGMRQDARYDPLLAKVVAHASGTDLAGVARKADRALSELAVAGVDTNVGLLRAVLADEEFRTGVVGTDWLGRRIADLTVRADAYPTAGPGAVRAPVPDVGAGDLVVRAPMAGTVVRTSRPEEPVPPGAPVAVVEAMKMEHPVPAP
ncbi:MAG: biotin carboxylase N-terminal domain-containing protein, partial [Nocardioidaceae bacterium]